MLAGASMGAHTLLWLALHRPERVAGAGRHHARLSTGSGDDDPARLAHWDALSDGLRSGGIDGFLAAYGDRGGARALARDGAQGDPPAARRCTSIPTRSPTRCVPCRARARSAAIDDLARDRRAGDVVASDDEADPEHPQAVGEAYAAAIPGAAWSPTSPAARRSPGRAASSRG